MSNPNNNCVMKGEISSEPKFIRRKDGTEFACEFFLEVWRNYRNKGIYESDFVPMRLAGEGIMQFAHTLTKGTWVDTISSYTTTKLENGKQIACFLISDIVRVKPQQAAEGVEVSVDLPI